MNVVYAIITFVLLGLGFWCLCWRQFLYYEGVLDKQRGWRGIGPSLPALTFILAPAFLVFIWFDLDRFQFRLGIFRAIGRYARFRYREGYEGGTDESSTDA